MPIFPGRRLRKPPPPPPPPPYQPLDIPEQSLEGYVERAYELANIPEAVWDNIVKDVESALNARYSADGNIGILGDEEEYYELPGAMGFGISLDPREWENIPSNYLKSVTDWDDITAVVEREIWRDLLDRGSIAGTDILTFGTTRDGDPKDRSLFEWGTNRIWGKNRTAQELFGHIYLNLTPSERDQVDKTLEAGQNGLADSYQGLANGVLEWVSKGASEEPRRKAYTTYQDRQLGTLLTLAKAYGGRSADPDGAAGALYKLLNDEATYGNERMEGKGGLVLTGLVDLRGVRQGLGGSELAAALTVEDDFGGKPVRLVRNVDSGGKAFYTYLGDRIDSSFLEELDKLKDPATASAAQATLTTSFGLSQSDSDRLIQEYNTDPDFRPDFDSLERFTSRDIILRRRGEAVRIRAADGTLRVAGADDISFGFTKYTRGLEEDWYKPAGILKLWTEGFRSKRELRRLETHQAYLREAIWKRVRGSELWRNAERMLTDDALAQRVLGRALTEEDRHHLQFVVKHKKLDKMVSRRESQRRTHDFLDILYDWREEGPDIRNLFRSFVWVGKLPILQGKKWATHLGQVADTFQYFLPAFYVGKAREFVTGQLTVAAHAVGQVLIKAKVAPGLVRSLPGLGEQFFFSRAIRGVAGEASFRRITFGMVARLGGGDSLKALYRLHLASLGKISITLPGLGRALTATEAGELLGEILDNFIPGVREGAVGGQIKALLARWGDLGHANLAFLQLPNVQSQLRILLDPRTSKAAKKIARKFLKQYGLDNANVAKLLTSKYFKGKLFKKMIGLVEWSGKILDKIHAKVFQKVLKGGLKVVIEPAKKWLSHIIAVGIGAALGGIGVVLEPVIAWVINKIMDVLIWVFQKVIGEAVKKVFGKAKDAFESIITFGTGERVGITGSLVEHLIWTGGAATATPFIAGCGCLFLIFIFPILILAGVHGPIARDLGTPLEVGGGFFEEALAAVADLNIQVSADPYNVPEGVTPSITYTVTATNNSSEAATSVSVEDLNFGRGTISMGTIGVGGSQSVVWSDILIDSPGFYSSCGEDATRFCNKVKLTAFLDSETVTDYGTGVVWIGAGDDEFPAGWPLASACVTQGPGGSYSHSGVEAIDFGRPASGGSLMGSSVHSTHSGRVEEVVYETTGYGHYVVVQSDLGFSTLYAHLLSINVTEGQVVSRGTTLGTVDNTGNSNADHLHYELISGGEITFSLPYVPVSVPSCSGREDCASMMGSEQCY